MQTFYLAILRTMRAILAALLFGGILYASPRVVIKLDASTGSAPGMAGSFS